MRPRPARPPRMIRPVLRPAARYAVVRQEDKVLVGFSHQGAQRGLG
jgi:hypothetical protein